MSCRKDEDEDEGEDEDEDEANSGPVWHFRCSWVRWLIKEMLTPCSMVIFMEKQRISSMIDGPRLPGITL